MNASYQSKVEYPMIKVTWKDNFESNVLYWRVVEVMRIYSFFTTQIALIGTLILFLWV